MKKRLFLNLSLILVLFTIIISCNHIPEPVPTDPEIGAALCSLKTQQTYSLLTDNNKTWNMFYKDSASNTTLNIPVLSSPTTPNTIKLQGYRILEYSYTGALIDTGSYTIAKCGKVLMLNTNLSGGVQPFIVNQLSYNNFTIYFKAPLGAGGSIITVKIVGMKQ